MNSQYMPQQAPQYGAPSGPGYGPPQGGYPPQGPSKTGPMTNQSGFQQPPQMSQQRGNSSMSMVRGNVPNAASPNMPQLVPNGPAHGMPSGQGPHGFQGMQNPQGALTNPNQQSFPGPPNVHGPPGLPSQPQRRGPQPTPPHSGSGPMGPPSSPNPNEIANQMAGMNMGGPPRVPTSNSGFPSFPPKGDIQLSSNSSPGYPGVVNGGPAPAQGPPGPLQGSQGQSRAPPGPPGGKQYVNGSMGPSPGMGGAGGPGGPGSLPPVSSSGGPPTGHSSSGLPPPHFSGPPQPSSMPTGMPPPPGGMPAHPGGMAPPRGAMSPQGGMPPPPGGMAPPSGGMGGMPPQPGGMGGMPPQPGGMGGMPPQPGGMGGMPPQPGGMGGMPPQPGGMGGMPPPPGGMGGMPPQPGGMGGMPPPPGGMGGMPPQPGGMGGMPPPSGGMGGMPPPPGGMGGMPPLPGGMGGMPPPGAPLQGSLPPPGRMTSGGYPQPGVPPTGDYHQSGMSGPGVGSSGPYGGPQPPMGSAQMQSHNYAQSAPSQSQQARRLDPDQMPSPIQVMQDDQRNRTGIFYTNQKGQVPPLVTTNYVTQDQGNAGPRYIRSTMYNIPATIDMMKQTAVPIGLVLSPLARTVEGEYPPPIVDMGELGPVRCIRCKAYMCPFMQFIDGGRRFHCLFCKATTEVPAEYFQHLDHTGQRVDRFERPELMLGTYEFVATKDYCRNNTIPKPPALIFLIDVSYNNIKSGMVHLLCKEMKEILKLLPRDAGSDKSVMRVGFITYNNTVHFYNIKGCLAQPQMMVVGDVQDMFMPLLEGFLCDPFESEAVIDSLMEQIPAMFADTRETETVLAPAIQAGLEALKASECAGKLLVFHSSLPIAEAPGKLKNRDERKLLATEKEKTVLAPQVNTYNNLGQDCVGAGCSVDLFVFNNSYIDIATIGQVSRLTGGEVFKYTYFQADLDGERLISDIKNNVSRPIAFDAIMRVRTSTGVRATDFFGHFFMSNTTDMELASIDCDKAVAVEIKHDDKLTEEDGVYIQVALLYTSVGGQRRLRVLNLSFKTCTQMADLYRSCDLDSIVNFFSKQVVFRLLESSPKQVKDGLVNRCAQMLACYRKNCASPSSAGQLILPECMKLLPLYVNCILKSDAVSGGSDMTIDDRSFIMQAVSIMDLPSSVVYFYPRLIPLHDIDVDSNEIPAPVRCTADKIRDDGVYLLENGIHMFLWIGLNVGMDWVQNVFGVHSAAQIDIDRTALPELDNPLSQRISSLVSTVRQQRHRSMRLTLVRQRDKLEMVFKHFLVEDRGFDGSASYVDFLCHMHKEIRNLLS